MLLLSTLSSNFSSWRQSWLQRRIPSARHHRLNHRNIFIFPSKIGGGFLLLVSLLWLLGTNYQNNLVIMLAFLLLSLMHTCIFYTYRNFSGLSIELVSVTNGFAGATAVVTLLLKSQAKKQQYDYQNIILQWQDCAPVITTVKQHQIQQVTIHLPLKERGWFMPKRLTISTRYPLGLLKAWTHIDLAAHVLVYPKPMKTELPDKRSASAEQHSEYKDVSPHHNLDDANDISHLRAYQRGDSPRHIAWKAYAKGQGLATTVYESMTTVEQQQWLDWNSFLGMSTEERLSRLCDCVLQAEQKGYRYGLILPDKHWPLANGEQHQQQLLQALALYGKPKHEEIKEVLK